MSTNHSSVLRMLTALTLSWSHNSRALTGKEFATIMHGLGRMSSQFAVIEGILQKIQVNLNTFSDIDITADQFAIIMNGLQSMGGGLPLPQGNFTSTANDLGFGIISPTSKRYRLSTRLLGFLSTLADQLERRSEILSPPQISAALFGFQVSLIIVCFTDECSSLYIFRE